MTGCAHVSSVGFMTMRASRLFLVALATLTLGACGLSPVYGTASQASAPVAAKLDSVYVEIIPNRSGQKLRNLLIDRMAQNGMQSPATAAYTLKIPAVSESIYSVGIAKDSTATRSQISMSTTATLVDNRNGGKPLMVRTLTSVASFNQLASQYTTLVTEEDAREQTTNDLASRIITQLELYFSNPEAFVQPETAKKPE